MATGLFHRTRQRWLSRSRLSYVLAAAGLLVISAATGFATYSVVSLYDSEVNSIRNRLQIPAQALAHVVRVITRNTDRTLRDIQVAVAEEQGKPDAAARWRQLMLDHVNARSASTRIDIYDVAGKPVVSSLSDPPPPALSVANLDFFQRQLAAKTDRLLISRIFADPLDGTMTFVASRPLLDAAGAVRGVVAAYFDTNNLQAIFDSLPMPEGSALVLFTREGRHLVRSPKVSLGDKILDVDFSQRASFRKFRDSGADGAFAELTTLAAGTKRFVAGVGDPGSEFVITAGWDTASALAPWRHEATIIIGYTLAGCAAVAGLFVYILVALRRNEALLTQVSRSEERFRALMNALPDAVLIIDQTLRIYFVNAAAEQLYGYEAGEMNGLGIEAFTAPSTYGDSKATLSEIFENWDPSRRLQGKERVALRRDGSELPVEINASPYESFGQRLLVAVVRDVSKRRANDRALRRSRESLARAQRVAGVGNFELDFLTGTRDWSDEFMRIWGIEKSPEEDPVGFLAQLVHPEDRAKFVAGREAVLAGEPHPDVDFRIIRPDGVERILHNEYSADFDAAGRPTRLFGTVQDVTERKRIEDELRRSRENLARAQRIAGVGSFERDLETGTIELSDELYRIHGVASAGPQASREFLYTLIHPDDREKLEEFRHAVEAGKPVPAIDYRIIRPDGVERVLHRESHVVFDESGKPAYVFGTLQDVTDRKHIETELRRSRESLARAQRIAALGSFDHDLRSDRVEWSDQLYRLYGLEPGKDRIGFEKVLASVHPDDRERFVEATQQAAQGIANTSIDFRIIRADGTERVLHRECDVTFDQTGRAIRMFGTLQDMTDRKRAELESIRSNENLAQAQRLAGIGSFERDFVAGRRQFSDEFLRIWGLEQVPAEGLHEALLRLVHPDDRAKFKEARAAAFQNRQVPPVDFRIIRHDGQERILHPEYRVAFDDKGKPLRFYGTVQDVTERKMIELELRRSRENLARAQQIAGIGSFERDLVTGKLEWSDEFLRIWGITERPTHGTAEILLSRVHPDDRQKFVDGRDSALRRQETRSLDFRIIRPDGEERILHREYGVMFGEAGKAFRMFGTIQDITERRRIELEMQRSRETLARAQRIAAIGSFERDLLTRQAEWSDEMFHVLGLEKTDEVPSEKALAKLIHPDDRERFFAYRAAELGGQPSRAFEYRIVRPNGDIRMVRRESAVIFSEDGRPLRIHGTLQDITERRLAERRERELERQLLHSQKLEALGTLAGGIAHDLNNTLVPIMALSKLTARRFEAGSLVRANLETIYEASERARDLVNRVVAFSRKDDAEKCETDLGEVVDEALKLLRATIPSSISLEAKIDKVPAIPADASQIHQIVTNLVSNAAQAIGGEIGTITIGLDLAPSLDRPSEIRLSVADTGAGMDEATQQRIFEPFFTTKPVGQGTGLGLSIVHGILAGHGGRIEVKSAPGTGTRFDLYFPIGAARVVSSSRPAA